MGSAKEFRELCQFLSDKRINLEGLVDSVLKGLESAEEAFDKMKNGSQFGKTPIWRKLNLQGKLVIVVSREDNGKL